jgi:hypothetical protein
MDFREVVRIIQEILGQSYSLTDVDILILQEVLKGKGYEEIAHIYSYSRYTIISQAARLWGEISTAANENINRGNFLLFVDSLVSKNPSLSQDTFTGVSASKIERSIEFPSEYWESGTSILSYFSRILSVKYPNKKITVKIEQEGLTLRMVIDTPDGGREAIEKTLDEYGLVVVGKMTPEEFMSDPLEAMALKNKLEIANLELRQTKTLLDFVKDNSQQRIGFLEVQVEKLHSIIEKGIHSGNNVFGVIDKMTEQNKSTYNLENAKFGGGFAAEGGLQVGGELIDLSTANSLADATKEIQKLLRKLRKEGVSPEDATQQAASDLATQAKVNPGVMSKVVKWGMDTAGKTTVGEATKGVIKLTLQILGIPLP